MSWWQSSAGFNTKFTGYMGNERLILRKNPIINWISACSQCKKQNLMLILINIITINIDIFSEIPQQFGDSGQKLSDCQWIQTVALWLPQWLACWLILLDSKVLELQRRTCKPTVWRIEGYSLPALTWWKQSSSLLYEVTTGWESCTNSIKSWPSFTACLQVGWLVKCALS